VKVVGLSGAQGAGKSTLLIELAARGWQLDKFRVSRAVQAELGWDSLERVMDSPNTMMKFQSEVFIQKFKNDQMLLAGEGMILTERTFADILAYTAQWTWGFVNQGKLKLSPAMRFLTNYTRDCTRAQDEIYTGTVLLPYMDHMIWEDDVNRAKLDDVHEVFNSIELFLGVSLPVQPRMKITGKTVQERADEVQTFLETLT
jgi:predicted ATPase